MRSALASLAAIVVSFLATYGLCALVRADAAPAVLAAVLAMTMMRRVEPFAWRTLLRRVATLPFVGIVAAVAGVTLHAAPVLGAALFCALMFASVWLRNFGPRARTLGSLLALPLVAALVVPVRIAEGHGPIFDALLVLAAGAIAVIATSLAATLLEAPPERPSEPARASSLRPSAPTRMALQLLVALILSFAVGLAFIPAHWPWIVLTAYIVCAGAHGRGDALYKGLLRFGGAIAGTLAAAFVPHAAIPDPTLGAIVIFAVLAAGLLLRGRSYAYWAGAMTLIFALLQQPQAQSGLELFAVRLLCIAIGATFGAGAAWFVLPIPSGNMVRLRLSEALQAFGAQFEPGGDAAARRARFERAVAALDRVAKPVELHRFVTRDRSEDHPAAWVARARDTFSRGRELAARGDAAPASLPGAIGRARRAIGAREGVPEALRRVGALLDGNEATDTDAP